MLMLSNFTVPLSSAIQAPNWARSAGVPRHTAAASTGSAAPRFDTCTVSSPAQAH